MNWWILPVGALLSSLTLSAHALALQADPQYDDLIESVVKVTKRRHFVEQSIDDQLSRAVFAEYIETLDPNHANFTQQDINELKRWETLLDDQLQSGRQTAAFAIYNRYLERASARL